MTAEAMHSETAQENGRLPPVASGYKQTNLGVLPSDWSTCSLGEIGQCLIGLTYEPRNISSDGLLVLRSSNIGDGNLQFDDHVFVNMEVPERIIVREDDLLICVRNGSRPLIGKCALIDLQAVGMTFGAFMSVFRSVNNRFVFYCFQSDIVRHQIHEHLGATINQITNRSLNSFVIPYPRAEEQRAIAEALSDVDGLFGALEALIAKKRAIKQAAMQQLLTGKTRLPGFSGKWVTTTLGEAADIRNGATPSTQITAFWNGSIPWCTPTDITGTPGKYLLTTERSITAEGLASCAASLLPAGALLLCSRATIGEIKIAASPVCTNQGFKSLVCKDGVSNEFLYYLLVTLKPQMIKRAIGSTFLEIGKRDVAAIEVRLPPCNEQHAITSILCDMDAEIAALGQRRDKTCAVKQGMMQQLLTGRVRLVKPE